jgi:hypothetical protein
LEAIAAGRSGDLYNGRIDPERGATEKFALLVMYCLGRQGEHYRADPDFDLEAEMILIEGEIEAERAAEEAEIAAEVEVVEDAARRL